MGSGRDRSGATHPPPPTPWCGTVIDLAGVGLGVGELDNLRAVACI
jgi:hypothetical protein